MSSKISEVVTYVGPEAQFKGKEALFTNNLRWDKQKKRLITEIYFCDDKVPAQWKDVFFETEIKFQGNHKEKIKNYFHLWCKEKNRERATEVNKNRKMKAIMKNFFLILEEDEAENN